MIGIRPEKDQVTAQYVYHDLKRILKIQDMKENALNVERSFKKI